jgi:phosphomannomutase
VASSIVSSRFIDRIAEANGAISVRTLTGFKWVARPIVNQPETTYLLGYEEALGYCIGDRVRDKDGISAALVMAELAAECRANGETVWGRLGRLIERYGLYATSQVTVGIGGLDDDEQTAVKQRSVSLDPAEVAGIAVTSREDLSRGERLPPTSGVVLELADGGRIIVRPSGTEPKIKAYLEVIEPAADDGGRAGNANEARRRAELRLGELARAIEAMLGS